MIHEQYTHTVKLQTHTHIVNYKQTHTHTVKLQTHIVNYKQTHTHTVKLQTHIVNYKQTHTHTVKLQTHIHTQSNYKQMVYRTKMFQSLRRDCPSVHVNIFLRGKNPTANLTILGVECKIVLFASLFDRT